MTRPHVVASLLLFFCLGLSGAALCHAAEDAAPMPERLAAEFPRYPGSRVIQAAEAPGVTMVMLECPGANLDEVYAHYKQAILAKGFELQTELEESKSRTMVGKRGEIYVMIDVGQDLGPTMVSLNLSSM